MGAREIAATTPRDSIASRGWGVPIPGEVFGSRRSPSRVSGFPGGGYRFPGGGYRPRPRGVPISGEAAGSRSASSARAGPPRGGTNSRTLGGHQFPEKAPNGRPEAGWALDTSGGTDSRSRGVSIPGPEGGTNSRSAVSDERPDFGSTVLPQGVPIPGERGRERRRLRRHTTGAREERFYFNRRGGTCVGPGINTMPPGTTSTSSSGQTARMLANWRWRWRLKAFLPEGPGAYCDPKRCMSSL